MVEVGRRGRVAPLVGLPFLGATLLGRQAVDLARGSLSADEYEGAEGRGGHDFAPVWQQDQSSFLLP